MRKFESLDAIRGIAAVAVVIYHTRSFFNLDPIPHAYLAVDLFFMISGVVVSGAYAERLRIREISIAEFFWIRAIRLYPLYILGSAISIIFLLTHLNNQLDADYIIIIFSLLCVPNFIIGTPLHLYPLNFPAWSLFHEFVVNVMFAFIIRFLSLRVLLSIIISALFLLIFVVTSLASDRSINIGFTFASIPLGFVRTAYSFFVGMLLLKIYTSNHAILPKFGGKMTPIALFGAVATCLLMKVSSLPIYLYDLAAVLFIFPILVFVGLLTEIKGRLATFLLAIGHASYALYAVHDPLTHFLGKVEFFSMPSTVTHRTLLQALYISMLIFMSIALSRFYDVAARSWLTRTFSSRGAALGSSSKRSVSDVDDPSSFLTRNVPPPA